MMFIAGDCVAPEAIALSEVIGDTDQRDGLQGLHVHKYLTLFVKSDRKEAERRDTGPLRAVARGKWDACPWFAHDEAPAESYHG